jgi:putative ABC transport system ATP-binding protein
MLEVRNVSKIFGRGTTNEVFSLSNVNLTLEEGSFTVVIGTNGSGKTTLFNAIAGTFFVDEGSIFLDGLDITRWPEHKRARYMGRVFQNPFSGTAPNLSIAENLALSARRTGVRGLGWGLDRRLNGEVKDAVRQLNMGLEDRLGNAIGTLSGGQRQALTLLMATWVRPRVLLADEPTAALDPRSAEQVIQLADEIIRREKLTTLLVTHSMQHAASLGDRLIMMHRSRLVLDLKGAEKRRLRPEDLLARFEDARRADLLDESAADLLERVYI